MGRGCKVEVEVVVTKRVRRQLGRLSVVLLLAGALVTCARNPKALDRARRAEAATSPVVLEGDDAHPLRSAGAWQAASPETRTRALRLLDGVLQQQRAFLHGRLEAQAAARSRAAHDTANGALFLVGVLALGLFVVPFVPWGRARGRRRAALLGAAAAFAIVVGGLLVSSRLLALLLEASRVASRGLDPQHAVLDAGFDLVEEQVQAHVAQAESASNLPLAPSLVGAEAAGGHDFLAGLIANLKYLDVESLRWSAQVLHVGHRLLDQMPHVVPFLVVLLFLLSLREVLGDVVRLPLEAVAGQRGRTRQAVRRLAGRLGREFLAVVGAVVVLLVLAASLQGAVRILATAATRLEVRALDHLAVGLAGLEAPPDGFLVGLGALAVPVFLLGGLGLAAFGTALVTLHARRILRARVHRGLPLKGHERFVRRAGLATLRLHWTPAIVATLILAVAERGTFDRVGDTPVQAFDALAKLAWGLGVGVVVGGLVLGVWPSVLWLLRFRVREPVPGDPPEGEATGVEGADGATSAVA